MKISLANAELDLIPTSHISQIHEESNTWFHLASGKEHYRLLIHLSSYFHSSQIADIGTYRGASAIALAQNPTNKIYSVDIGVFRKEITVNNIEFAVGNFQTNDIIKENILKSKFIMLDIDHNYTNEIWLYNFLIQNNWNGIMLCDDINLNDEMRRFWSEITHVKYDITKYGHFSGTGLILFGDDITIEAT
jgi:predicted O-methyltransferase YrrM